MSVSMKPGMGTRDSGLGTSVHRIESKSAHVVLPRDLQHAMFGIFRVNGAFAFPSPQSRVPSPVSQGRNA